MLRPGKRLKRRLEWAAVSLRAASLWPLAALRPANVMMVHIGRSGSGVLCNLLGQHPRIRWDGEIYAPARRLLAESADPMRFLQWRMAAAGRQIFGFEVKFFHAGLIGMDFAEFFAAVERLGFERFIVLRRQNTLRKIVSSMVLNERGRAHRSANRSAKLHRIRIDVNEVNVDRDCKPLLAYLEDYEQGFELLDELLVGRDALRLSYEDHIAADPTVAYRMACDFIGVEPREARIAFGKNNPFPLEEIVTNFDEVAGALQGTSFEWMTRE
jgi:hypothetical protein